MAVLETNRLYLHNRRIDPRRWGLILFSRSMATPLATLKTYSISPLASIPMVAGSDVVNLALKVPILSTLYLGCPLSSNCCDFTASLSPPSWHTTSNGHLGHLPISAPWILSHFYIKEPELIDCLSILPTLQEISIVARFPKPLITDSLLMALAWTPDDSGCLVPRLRSLDFSSHLRFDDNVYLSVLVSRCESGASTGAPTTSRIRPSMEYCRRRLDSNVAARIQNICAQAPGCLDV
ncbi:hypothetical protein C8R45DRAFT_1212969 [Mycena sanguinolenta]|nr:hypothetical protein C8R45DRAFT_1212969 [Mycena sanguinolenta]